MEHPTDVEVESLLSRTCAGFSDSSATDIWYMYKVYEYTCVLYVVPFHHWSYCSLSVCACVCAHVCVCVCVFVWLLLDDEGDHVVYVK